MGSCCGSESREVEGHQLQSLNKDKKKATASGGQALGGGSQATSEGSREAMLSAAEQRRIQAENRGVKEGGKLSKQLAEQKKHNQPISSKNELDDKLVWD